MNTECQHENLDFQVGRNKYEDGREYLVLASRCKACEAPVKFHSTFVGNGELADTVSVTQDGYVILPFHVESELVR